MNTHTKWDKADSNLMFVQGRLCLLLSLGVKLKNQPNIPDCYKDESQTSSHSQSKPAYPNGSNDLFSQLHVYGCIIATILSWLLYLHLLYDLSKKNILAFHHCLQPTLWIVCLFTFVILLFGDISSLAELILLNGLNYLFLSLQKQTP